MQHTVHGAVTGVLGAVQAAGPSKVLPKVPSKEAKVPRLAWAILCRQHLHQSQHDSEIDLELPRYLKLH